LPEAKLFDRSEQIPNRLNVEADLVGRHSRPLLEIRARAEGFLSLHGAGDDDRLGFPIEGDLSNRFAEEFQKPHVKAVQRLGTIYGQDFDPVPKINEQTLVSAHTFFLQQTRCSFKPFG
jgi:hypothetical protein